MKIEEKIEKFKKIYQTIQPPEYLSQHGWDDIANKLTEQTQPKNYHLFFSRSFAFAAVTLFLLGGTVLTAQAAKPNDILYPVKVLSDNIVAKFTRSPHTTVEKRVEDIVEATKESPQNLDSATKEYEKALDNAKADVKGANDKKELEKTLDRQAQKLRHVSEANKASSSAKMRLEDAIKITERTKTDMQKSDNSSNAEPGRNNNIPQKDSSTKDKK